MALWLGPRESMARPQAKNGGAINAINYWAPGPQEEINGWVVPRKPMAGPQGPRKSMAGPQEFNDWC